MLNRPVRRGRARPGGIQHSAATAPRTVKTMRPAGVAASMHSDKLTNSIPRTRKVSSARKRWLTLGANRSNFRTATGQTGACAHLPSSGLVVAACLLRPKQTQGFHVYPITKWASPRPFPSAIALAKHMRTIVPSDAQQRSWNSTCAAVRSCQSLPMAARSCTVK